MVTVIEVVQRKNAKDETFVALILSSGIEMIKSNAGKFYASVRRASVPCTLDYEIAKSMVGQKMPGTIIKKPTKPYPFTTKKGEVIEIDFTYEFTDEVTNIEENVFS
ncbi:MAG: hypothetical protein Q8M29_00485 [Bacteroidota bacterium]|nr:hypothetical protein [Bacteroidota bacterium]